MPQPKNEFLKSSADVKAFQDIADSPIFGRAVNVALLDFIEQQPPNASQADAVANAYRLEGARAYARTLQKIAEAPEPKPPKPAGNLNHRA